MSKLSYPSEGIYTYCKNYTSSCYRKLSRVLEKCDFDIPTDFTYYNYLKDFKNRMYNYRNEINAIDSKLQSVDKRFQELDDDLTNQIRKKDFIDIKSRDRMIL